MASSNKKIEKMRSLLKHAHERAIVKDEDLQLQLSHAKELQKEEGDVNFREIYSHYIKEQSVHKEPAHAHTEEAMHEMETAFHEMMEINKQLRDGWQELIQMQNK